MDNKKLARATNSFGFNLLRRLCAGEAKDKNAFISPSSIAFALSMTLNGASGETRKAMASALGVGAESLDEVNAANTALIAELRKADPKVRLEIANALFTKAGYPFNPAFLDTNKQHYGAEVSGLDFTGDQLYLEDRALPVRDEDIVARPRIGIAFAGEPWISQPWRLYERGNRWVSKR